MTRRWKRRSSTVADIAVVFDGVRFVRFLCEGESKSSSCERCVGVGGPCICSVGAFMKPLSDAGIAGFSQSMHEDRRSWMRYFQLTSQRKPRRKRVLGETGCGGCTVLRQGAVNGVQSIENAGSYRGVFFVDGKNRRSTTRSFFDSFLSFSSWCGVRGSSRVTVLTERLRWRASEGL